MPKISLLDCTLRDGAYITGGRFGARAIRGLIRQFQEARLDIIECGWLKNPAYEEGSSYYHVPDDLLPCLGTKNPEAVYVAMIDWDRYDLDRLPPCDGRSLDAIRVVFPREKYREGLRLAEPIRRRGYRVFFQAANTLGYRDDRLIDMIHAVNDAGAESISIVDTFGAMYRDDLLRIMTLVDHNLDPGIRIGLHSHNNLQQSFSLAMAFAEWFRGSDREIVIDGSLAGMGRGAGNAPTELLASYLNRFHGRDFDMNAVMDAIDLYMTHFQREYQWGYSTPFFLSGTYCAHVNNIAYLTKSHRTTNADIKGILESMPEDKRLVYDYDLLEEKYLEFKAMVVDDSEATAQLRTLFAGKRVLLLAPGTSILTERDRIASLQAADGNLLTIGVNAAIEGFRCDWFFFTGEMRFKYAVSAGGLPPGAGLILTSNILRAMPEAADFSPKVISFNNISKRGWLHFDNSAILCLRLLDRLHVRDILLAGLDGYRTEDKNGYADGLLRSDIDPAETRELNREIAEMLADFRKSHEKTRLTFLTPSLFAPAETL